MAVREAHPWVCHRCKGTGIDPRLAHVIVAGGSEPMHPDWVRSIRDQCAGAGILFWFGSWGEFIERSVATDDSHGRYSAIAGGVTVRLKERLAGRPWAPWGAVTLDGLFHKFAPEWRGAIKDGTWDKTAIPVVRVGAKNSGRTLDGKEHLEVPERKMT